MPVRTIVSFNGDFPFDGDPAGKELADFISSALRSMGIEHTGPDEREGWAWDIYSQAGTVQVECIIGFMDDGPRQWLVTTHGHLPLLSRIFGGNGEQQRENALRQFCQAIDRGIKRDPRFNTVRWYVQKDFDKDHGATWSDTP